MAGNTVPIFPAAVLVGVASLVSAAPITSRADIVGTAGLVKLTDPVTNAGGRVDAIRVKCKATSVAGLIGIWLYDGTTSRLIDEIPVSAVTASATVDSFAVERPYSNWNLAPNQQLYVSETVANDANVLAFGGAY
jgi:hypothetical protein